MKVELHDIAGPLLERVRSFEGEMVDFLCRLARAESPSDVAASQAGPQRQLREALAAVGFRVRHVPGRATGGHLYARPADRVRGRPAQLMLGHADTVWPIGTLAEMPVRQQDGCVSGPGTFDMKGGLTQIVFALRALRELGLEPPATPVVLINSDEEVGSPESGVHVRRLARHVCRAYVIEPSLGPEGLLKTARKGVGAFSVHIRGRAAHAGLDPQGGASAIEELAHVILTLHGLTDVERGTTVNVGVVEGGLRPNVIAPSAEARVDLRVLTAAEGRRMEAAVLGLEPRTPGVSLRVEGGMRVEPLERTARNRRLWEHAREAGAALGLDLGEAIAGGASDGNTTSAYTATLDGLGPVGDGAHAAHEHVKVQGLVERCALLACLLLAPLDGT